MDFFLKRGQRYGADELEQIQSLNPVALFAWGAGITIALLTTRDIFTLTSIPACDSLLVAAILYTMLGKHRQ